jgi:hypothetical protein
MLQLVSSQARLVSVVDAQHRIEDQILAQINWFACISRGDCLHLAWRVLARPVRAQQPGPAHALAPPRRICRSRRRSFRTAAGVGFFRHDAVPEPAWSRRPHTRGTGACPIA